MQRAVIALFVLLLLISCASAQKVSLSQEDMGICNPTRFSASKTGTVLATAIASTGSATLPDCSGNKTLLIPPGNWVISSNLTIPARMALHVAAGGILTATNAVLTLQTIPMCDRPAECIATSGTGTVVIDASAMPLRTVSADITHFGACHGCSATLNTAAIQAVMTAFQSVYIPPGDFHVNAVLTSTNKPLSIRGAGRKVSQLIWDTDPGGIAFTTDSILKPLTIEDISLVTGVVSGGTCVAALLTPDPGTSSSSTGSFQSVECIPLTGGTHYWDKGLELTNMWNAVIYDYTYLGIPPASGVFTANYGVHLLGNSIDVQMDKLHIYHASIGINVGGTVEGPVITNFHIVSVEQGILLSTAAAEPGCTISGGHINAFAVGIRLSNRTECFINDISIYKFAGSTVDWTGIDLPDGGFGNDHARIRDIRIAPQAGTSGAVEGVKLTRTTFSHVNDISCQSVGNCIAVGGVSAQQNTITNNRSQSSTNTILVTTGALNNYIRSNFPSDGVCTLTANSATPSVADCPTDVFITANTVSTTYTNFANGQAGQNISIRAADNNSLMANNSTIKTASGGTVPLQNAMQPIQLRYDGAVWYELGVSAAPPLAYTTDGTAFIGTKANHFVVGNGTIGGGGSTSFTFTNAAVFTDATTFVCVASGTSTGDPLVVTLNSGTSITVAGTAAATFSFNCVGH